MQQISVSVTLPRIISIDSEVKVSNKISAVITIPQTAIGTGTGSEDTMAEFIATENISQYEVVTADGKVADSSNLSHRTKVIGIAKTAVSSGFTGQAQVGGVITNPSWSFTVGQKLFLNSTSISNIPPSTGFIQSIGKAVGVNKILVDIDEPITL